MAEHRRPVFHFYLSWSGAHIGFTEVSGLNHDNLSNITLKRGISKGKNQLLQWLMAERFDRGDRRDLVISLLNEEGEPTLAWKVLNAFPVKVEGPTLEARGNDVAIESIELAHEGLELQKP